MGFDQKKLYGGPPCTLWKCNLLQSLQCFWGCLGLHEGSGELADGPGVGAESPGLVPGSMLGCLWGRASVASIRHYTISGELPFASLPSGGLLPAFALVCSHLHLAFPYPKSRSSWMFTVGEDKERENQRDDLLFWEPSSQGLMPKNFV